MEKDNKNLHAAESIFEPEVHKHHRRRKKLLEFTHSSTRATMIMLGAAVLALIIENTPLLPNFSEFWNTFYIGISIGSFDPHISIGHFINDFLMALFFLVVGLEIKYEFTAGELTNPRKALLPIIAAAGGAVLPALVYLAFNAAKAASPSIALPASISASACISLRYTSAMATVRS